MVANGFLSLFSMMDGSFMCDIDVDDDMIFHYAGQVEEAGDGWLVADRWNLSPRSGRISSSAGGYPDHRLQCLGFAVAHELGLLFGVHVLSNPSLVVVYATPEAMSTGVMSLARVAWMVSVTRAIQWRSRRA